MKILLDHCVDVRVRGLFPGHDVSLARDEGWKDLGNGKLLTAAAAAKFEVMVTADKNIRHQQNLAALPLAILEINLPRNRFRDIAPLAPFLPAALEQTRRYLFVSIKADGTSDCFVARNQEPA